MQAIHPNIMNQMKRKDAFFKVNSFYEPICTNTCESLDKLAPFNMNFVFVSSFYTDRVTAIDFLSRLGNFESLSLYKHYF